MDVLLAHSNMLRNDPKQMLKMAPYPPLATLYAAAALRGAGYSVALTDLTFADSLEPCPVALRDARPHFFVLQEDLFNFISKMCLEHMRETACVMCRAAKEAGATVIASGPDINDRPSVFLEGGVDYVIAGEPDATLLELIGALNRPQPLPVEAIPGIVFRKPDGSLVRTPERAPLANLDSVPLPAWDLVDVTQYREAWMRKAGYFSLNMVASRGCPFQCAYCAKPIWDGNYVQRSPESVAAELELLKTMLNPDRIWFADDIFTTTPEWLEAFGREVAVREAAIPYLIQTRVDLITEEAATLLARSGCREVWLGVESGSQRMLDAMKKRIRTQDIHRVRHWLKAAGIRTGFFVQFGYLGETFEDIMVTVRMIRELLPDDIGVSVSYPLPGTQFYQQVCSQLGDKTHWEHSNDLSMMYQGSYETEFYRRLHDLLHRDLDLRLYLAGRKEAGDLDPLEEISALSDAWLDLGRMEGAAANPRRSMQGCGV